MNGPKRPLLGVLLGLALGAGWGAALGLEPWHPLLALPACLPRRTRWTGLALLAMLLRCASPDPSGLAGPWHARAGLLTGGPQVRLEPGSVREGEWIELFGEGSPLLEARAPHHPLRCVRRSFCADDVQRRSIPGGWTLHSPWPEWRQAGLRRLDRAGSPLTRGLLRALLLGDRSQLDSALVDGFTRTGTRHLLALSGLHVGLVAWLVAAPVAAALTALLGLVSGGRLRLAPEALRAGLILAIVPLAGGGAPVSRAAIALALASLAPLLRDGSSPQGRRADTLSLWALALIVELSVEPSGALRPGIQLSYVATLGLLLATGPTTRVLRRSLPGQCLLPGATPSLVRVAGQRIIDLFVSGLAASWVATCATAPLLWFHFGEIAPAGILATPLAMPPLVILIALGWLAMVIPAMAPTLLLEAAADYLVALVSWTDKLPATPLVLPERPFIFVALVSWAGLAVGTGLCGTLVRRLVSAGLGLLLLPWAPAPQGLQVVLLDVGHGTCVLVRAPGAGTLLFDAGSRDRVGVGSAAVSAVLRNWDVGPVTVVASHEHRDHVGALPWIMQRWPVTTRAGALEGGLDVPHGRLVIPSRGALRITLVRGSKTPGNEGSRNLELLWGTTRIWLTGDAEQEGLAAALEAGHFPGPSALLLLPHHGSSTPHLGRLLAETRPREVWISSGAPPPVGAELSRRGLSWACTHLHGPQERVFGLDSHHLLGIQPGRHD